MATFGFGQLPIAEGRFGDLASTLQIPAADAILVSYVVQPTSGAATLVSYTIEVPASAAIPIHYVVRAATVGFSINHIAIPQPHHVYYALPAQVGYDQLGVPIIQGYTSMIWEYEEMLDSGIAVLMNLYNPASPIVTVTYLNELGGWITKSAMMQPPNLGQRQTIEHDTVQFTFTHISTD